MTPELLSVKQAAAWLGVTQRTVRGLVHAGRLETRRPSRRAYVTLVSLETYVGRRSPAPEEAPVMTDAEWDAMKAAAYREMEDGLPDSVLGGDAEHRGAGVGADVSAEVAADDGDRQ